MGIGVSQVSIKLIVEEDLTTAGYVEIIRLNTMKNKMKIRAHVPKDGFNAQTIWDLLGTRSKELTGGLIYGGHPLKHSAVKIHTIEFKGAQVSPEVTLKARTGDYVFFYVK